MNQLITLPLIFISYFMASGLNHFISSINSLIDGIHRRVHSISQIINGVQSTCYKKQLLGWMECAATSWGGGSPEDGVRWGGTPWPKLSVRSSPSPRSSPKSGSTQDNWNSMIGALASMEPICTVSAIRKDKTLSYHLPLTANCLPPNA